MTEVTRMRRSFFKVYLSLDKYNNNHYYYYMKLLKHSRQRDMIRDYLAGNAQHPTADDVYLFLRAQDPVISLGTVYRNLNQLAQSGEIRRITLEGKDRFDYNTDSHGHFICKGCGRIFDIEADVNPFTERSESDGFQVDQAELLLYGRCPECSGQ